MKAFRASFLSVQYMYHELPEEERLVERTSAREAQLGAPEFARRWARRAAGVAALGLMVFVVAPKLGLPVGAKSTEFLEGVGGQAWHTLESELDASKELPTVGLAHISPAAGQVLCVIDVAQAVARVMLTGTFIKFSTVACDFDRIEAVKKRPVRNDERETCASGIFGILLSVELGMGVIASSISTCSGSLNVPANCAANIGAFTGGLSVLMQSTLSADLICNKGVKAGKLTPEAKIDAVISAATTGKITKQKKQVSKSVYNYLKKAGVDVSTLPAPPAVPNDAVYGAVARCVAQLDLGATFVMRFAIILADSTIHCTPGVVQTEGRVCAVDITGILAVLSLSVRFFSLASNSCVNIVGRADKDANCVAACSGITGSTMAMTSSGMNLDAACRKAFGKWDPDAWPSNLGPVSASGQTHGEELHVPARDGNTIIAELPEEERLVGRTSAREAQLGAPEFARRWARHAAGVAALGLMVFVVAPKLGLPVGAKSTEFLEGVGGQAWHTLESELDASKELPTVGLAHISPAAGQVLCVIDVAQAVARVMLTGTFIKFSTVACDFDRIQAVKKRPVRNDERETCASGIFGILLSVELGMGVIASSISTCSGSLNVPANCAANIGAFTGGLSVLMQSTLSADLICNKGVKAGKLTPEAKIDAVVSAATTGKITKQKKQVSKSVYNYLKKAGVDVSTLPAPPAVPNDAVYGAVARCVAQLDLGATFVMRFAIILADTTIHCTPGVVETEGRVCAVDITGILAVLSLSVRFFSLASNSCVNIVGRADKDANCVAACSGITGSTMAMTSSGMNLDAACRKAFGKWDPDAWPSQLGPVSASGQTHGEELHVPARDGNTIIAEP
ncbi:cta4 [Symbiodinium natans]|uniref:Cta4 protein n=1 Tax=Symbiodinium natans TaxID=878477 RepID=A0A812L8H7_9DINO|nr:cta4 [Symbiodinium natans]